MHWQEAALLFLVLHTALAPQGDGLHGLMSSVGTGTATKNFFYRKMYTYLEEAKDFIPVTINVRPI
jgi:hypothetical protein